MTCWILHHQQHSPVQLYGRKSRAGKACRCVFAIFPFIIYWVNIIRELQLKELQPWGGRQWQLLAGKEESRAARRRRGGIWESVIWCQGHKRVYGIQYVVWYQRMVWWLWWRQGDKRRRLGFSYEMEKVNVGNKIAQGENIKVRVQISRSGWKDQGRGENIKLRVKRSRSGWKYEG